ncbi:unnamed protein product [Nesidiocoris tenuis]|uniref:GDT1 family protein n=1 Tax=Nesidiocoris tenuis TaxID=355587 RepID=A0A6H5HAX7_9HEMI|nr:unnamed protein product [Nesidiocoris tenuis]
MSCYWSPTAWSRTPNVDPYSDVVKNSKREIEFLQGFIASCSVIVISEIADKTFFIAAIMAMKHSRLAVFFGAILALSIMSVLSVVFGWAATVIPRIYTYYVSTALFFFFGVKMLVEGFRMTPEDSKGEFQQVESDLKKTDDDASEDEKENINPVPATAEKLKMRGKSCLKISKIVVQAFTLTFLAEWGDRSQLATIILAAREDVYGVTLGSITGHAFCSGLAVISGRYLAEKISVKSVTILGGIVFLVFAITSLIFDPQGE